MKQNRLFKYAMLLAWMICSFVGAGCSEDEGPGYRMPKLSINETPSNLTYSSATLSGYVELFGTAVDQCGFIVHSTKGILEKEGIYESAAYTGVVSSDGTVTLDLTDLEAETTYYYCLFVKAGKTVLKSNILPFDTPAKTSPTVSLLEIGAGVNYCVVSGQIENEGDSEVTERGFIYSRSSNNLVVGGEGVTQVAVDAQTAQFSARIQDLQEATTYYVRAYAANKPDGITQYGYSEVKDFKTWEFQAPVVGAVNVKQEGNTLKLSCAVTDNGIQMIEQGFCWSTNNMQPTVEDKILVGEIDDDKTMSGILPDVTENTTYYIRAYIRYSRSGTETVAYSEVHKEKVDTLPSPEITNIRISDVDWTSAHLLAEWQSNNVKVMEKGFLWGTSSNPTTELKVTGADFTKDLSGLAPGTTYHVKAYVKYKWGENEKTAYSASVYDFKTTPFQGPELGYVNSVQTNNILDFSCSITDNGVQLFEQGFCWSTNNKQPTVNDNKVAGQIANNVLSGVMQNVKENTTYYIRAYVIYDRLGTQTTEYGEGTSITTDAFQAPEISSITISDVSKVSAKLSAVWNPNDVPVSEKGFMWGTTDNPTTVLQVTGTDFEAELTGLDANKRYYVKAYVKYKWGNTEKSVSSNLDNFTTASIEGATVETPEVSAVSFKEATVKASIADMGEGTLVKKGFYWGTDYWNLSLENCIGQKELTAEEDFQYTITELSDNTWYYVKAYAVTEGNGQTLISSSPQAEFSTIGISGMGFNDLSVSEITDASFKVTASAYNWGNVDITEVGFCWSLKDEAPEDMQLRKAVERDGDSFSLTVNENLTEGAVYYVYGYAVNSFGTVTYTPKSEVQLKRMPADNENPYPEKE